VLRVDSTVFLEPSGGPPAPQFDSRRLHHGTAVPSLVASVTCPLQGAGSRAFAVRTAMTITPASPWPASNVAWAARCRSAPSTPGGRPSAALGDAHMRRRLDVLAATGQDRHLPLIASRSGGIGGPSDWAERKPPPPFAHVAGARKKDHPLSIPGPLDCRPGMRTRPRPRSLLRQAEPISASHPRKASPPCDS